jgi:hypothetical protein
LRRRGLLVDREKNEVETKEDEKKKKKQEEEEKKKEKKDAEEKKKKDEPVLTKRQLATIEAKEFYFIQADNTLLTGHPSISLRDNALQTQEEVEKALQSEELNGPIGYGI